VSDEKPQLSRADLAKMSDEEIVAAQRAGQFAELLAGRDPGAEL
jgi:hypothetical protein